MNYVIGAVVGLLWGALIAWVNSRINKSAIAKNTTKALMRANLCRTGLDIFGLGMVFLLRKVLPFSFEATIVATAAARTRAGIRVYGKLHDNHGAAGPGASISGPH